MILLLAPITPHIAEELWQRIGGAYSVHQQAWPEFNAELAKEDTVEIAIQINGKIRAKLDISPDIDSEAAKAQALALEAIQEQMNGKTPVKVIYVPGRLVNIVIA